VYSQPRTRPFGMGRRCLSWMRSGVRCNLDGSPEFRAATVASYLQAGARRLWYMKCTSPDLPCLSSNCLAVSHRFLSELEYVFVEGSRPQPSAVPITRYSQICRCAGTGSSPCLAGEELAAQEDFVPHEDGTDCLQTVVWGVARSRHDPHARPASPSSVTTHHRRLNLFTGSGDKSRCNPQEAAILVILIKNCCLLDIEAVARSPQHHNG
jgi:hypothetical protein